MERDLQLVPAPAAAAKPAQQQQQQLTVSTAGVVKDGAIVEYAGKAGALLREDEEDLEVKLRRIIDNVPVRVSNTSGSSAGAGSGDFHQYRQMRRKEQDRLARMDVDYQRRKEIAEFNLRREERMKDAEERTAKKRLKRQKRKQRKKEKKIPGNDAGEGHRKEESSEDDYSDDVEE
uniref:PRKR-interacting protein 1 n=1 Tax=Anthurium amnicola TaxID=1678845 RepID=A0A1D1XLH6_9ARAE